MNKSARKALSSRLLITMPWGIGDAIHVGLSAVDQIIPPDRPEPNEPRVSPRYNVVDVQVHLVHRPG